MTGLTGQLHLEPIPLAILSPLALWRLGVVPCEVHVKGRRSDLTKT